MEHNKINSFSEVDFSKYDLPSIAVYEHPEDFPTMCVARIYNLASPTHTYMVKKSIREITKDIKKNTKMIEIGRTKDDVPALNTVWV